MEIPCSVENATERESLFFIPDRKRSVYFNKEIALVRNISGSYDYLYIYIGGKRGYNEGKRIGGGML